MAGIDDKTSQKVFKDYARGYHIPEIAERHGLTPAKVLSAVKFESAVNARVKQETERLLARTQKPKTAPKAGKIK